LLATSVVQFTVYYYYYYYPVLILLLRWVSRHQKRRTILVKPIWIYWSKRHWVAVASAGQYANLYLAPDR